MNNKGQTLVIFVIILPILLIVSALLINLGILYVDERNINNVIDDAMDYYIENINTKDVLEKTKVLLNKNIENITNININETDGNIVILLEKKYNGINDKIIKVEKSKKID